MATVLALDVGSSSVRAQRFDERGDPVDGLRREAYEGNDPDAIVRLVREAIAGRADGVDAVGVSCFGQSLLALDREGRPLTELLGWQERRSASAVGVLRARVDAAALQARTGAHLHPSYWPAKLVWLAETRPDVFRSAARFVSFGEYLYERLLGAAPAASLSLASGTGLLDLAAKAWDDELLAVLGLDEGRLSPVSDEPHEQWQRPVVDAACSNLGAGCTGAGRAALMVGTSGALRVLCESDRFTARPGLFLYRLDERRVVEGGALSDGGNLYAWLRRTLAGPAEDLGESAPGEHGLTFLPFLGGERSTGWDADATGVLAGLTFRTTTGDIRRAALEGVALRFAEIAELLPGLDQVVATGRALLADPAWVQIMADALARPVVVSGVPEASLRGAAVWALGHLGHTAADAALGTVFDPARERAEAYRSARARQRRLYEERRGTH
jgi:gluconokinase